MRESERDGEQQHSRDQLRDAVLAEKATRSFPALPTNSARIPRVTVRNGRTCSTSFPNHSIIRGHGGVPWFDGRRRGFLARRRSKTSRAARPAAGGYPRRSREYLLPATPDTLHRTGSSAAYTEPDHPRRYTERITAAVRPLPLLAGSARPLGTDLGIIGTESATAPVLPLARVRHAVIGVISVSFVARPASPVQAARDGYPLGEAAAGGPSECLFSPSVPRAVRTAGATRGGRGQAILIERSNARADERKAFVIPYAFHSDVLSTAFAVAAGGRGVLQEQDAVVLNLVGSTNGSWVAYLFGEAFRTPWSDRLFLSPRHGRRLRRDRYLPERKSRGFRTRWPAPTTRARTTSFAARVRISGTDSSSATCSRSDTHGTSHPDLRAGPRAPGRRVDPGDWNPLHAGRTVLEVEPFFRGQDYDADIGSDELETGGVRLNLRYENVDFLPNPSKGSVQRLSVTWDPGVQDDESSYVFSIWSSASSSTWAKARSSASRCWRSTSGRPRPPAGRWTTLPGNPSSPTALPRTSEPPWPGWIACAALRAPASTTGRPSTTQRSCASYRSGIHWASC